MKPLDTSSTQRLTWAAALAISLIAHYLLLTSFPTGSRDLPKNRSADAIAGQPLISRVLQYPIANVALESTQVTSAVLAQAAESPHTFPLPDTLKEAAAPQKRSNPTVEKSGRAIQELDGFYPYEDVDQPASPVDDWQLPLQVISQLHIQLVAFRVWIKDNGDIQDAQVLSSTPVTLSGQDQERIATALSRTKMTPAIKNGQKVPSQRTIELALEP